MGWKELRKAAMVGASVALLGAAALFFYGCTNHSSDQDAGPAKTMTAPNQAVAEAVVYTCPMHPDYTSDKPGKCPICGMTLVKKEKASMSMDHGMKPMNMPAASQGGAAQ